MPRRKTISAKDGKRDCKCSNARVKRLTSDISHRAKEIMEKLYPGYRFVQCIVKYSDIVDGVYIRCVMRKNEIKGVGA